MRNLKSLGQAVLNGAIASTIFNLCLGRFTFFAVIFSIVGIYGWLHLGRDLSSYALFVGAIQSLVAVHSMHEDYRDYKNNQLQQTVINNTAI